MAHPIVHWEIAGADAEELAKFYGSMFGWKFETPLEDYHMTAAEETGVGGAVGRDTEGAASVTIYFGVPDVVDALEKAVAGGATITMPRTVIPGMVAYGRFRDPAGNEIGVVEATTPPAE